MPSDLCIFTESWTLQKSPPGNYGSSGQRNNFNTQSQNEPNAVKQMHIFTGLRTAALTLGIISSSIPGLITTYILYVTLFL